MPTPRPHQRASRLPGPADLDRLKAAAASALATPGRRSLATVEEALVDICATIVEVERARRSLQQELRGLLRDPATDGGATMRIVELLTRAESVLDELERLRRPLQGRRFALSQ